MLHKRPKRAGVHGNPIFHAMEDPVSRYENWKSGFPLDGKRVIRMIS
jgi:hypothetical protein